MEVDEEFTNTLFPTDFHQHVPTAPTHDDSDNFSDFISVSQVGTLFSASGIQDPSYVPSISKSSNISDYFSEEDNSDSFVFCCEVHSLTFENLEDFEEHQISNHSVNGRVACGICDKTYSTKYLRRNHIKGYHLGEKFTCGVQNCGKTFPLKRYRDAHERSYRHQGTNSSLLYACDVCNEVFNELEELKQHKLKHSSTKKFHCEYCKVKGYTRLSDLKRHEAECPSKIKPSSSRPKSDVSAKHSGSGKLKEGLRAVKRKLFSKKSETASSKPLPELSNIFDSEPEDKDNGQREQPMRGCKNGIQEGFYKNGGSPRIKTEKHSSSSSSSGGPPVRSPKPSIKGQHRCSLCKQNFSDRMKLLEHCDKLHSKKRIRNYPCRLCGVVYQSDEMFKFHMQQHQFDDMAEIKASQKGGKKKKPKK